MVENQLLRLDILTETLQVTEWNRCHIFHCGIVNSCELSAERHLAENRKSNIKSNIKFGFQPSSEKVVSTEGRNNVCPGIFYNKGERRYQRWVNLVKLHS